MDVNNSIGDNEINTLLNDLLEVHGYDFTNYSKASIKRRIENLYTKDKFPSFAEFRYKLRNDENYLLRFVEQVTVNVTEMFRDPLFYKTLRTQVLPMLAARPVIRIWHAGCSTGEEVYSMAILLKEANLLHKSLLYATDINPAVLQNRVLELFDQSLETLGFLAIGSKETLRFSTIYTKYRQLENREKVWRKMQP